MIPNIKTHTKVRCPCGKFNWVPNFLVKRGLGKYCNMACASKFKVRSPREVEDKKYSLCDRCGRRYLTKLGCLFCKKLEKR